jgi:NitT/TauT family transport system permease protein
MQASISSPRKDIAYKLLGTILIIFFWQLLSMRYLSVLVPSPAETLTALKQMLLSGEIASNLRISFERQIAGLLLGVAVGTATGLLAGLRRPLELMMSPLVNSLITIPAVIFVVMAMVWFGMGTVMAVFLVSLLVFPIMHINIVEGFKSIDSNYLQMARVYRVPLKIRLQKIYLPGILHSFLAGISLSVATSIRLTIMAELLGAQDGMGQRIAISRAYLQTDQLFAWVLVLIFIVFILDWLLIRPVNRMANRWKAPN